MSGPTVRNFKFPVSTLLRDAKRLVAALTDANIGPSVVARLATAANPTPVDAITAQISLVEKGGADLSGASGDVGALTQTQALAFTELERLMSAARRSAALSFPAGDARLRSEFQVGVHEPQDLASELERGRKIHAAAIKYAAQVGEHGWIAVDSTALESAITTLAGADEGQEAAKGKKKGVTAGRNAAANVLYKQCLSVQNAARLAYPNTKTDSPGVIEARARFLLDEFPPASGASAGDSPDPHGPAAPSPSSSAPAPTPIN